MTIKDKERGERSKTLYSNQPVNPVCLEFTMAHFKKKEGMMNYLHYKLSSFISTLIVMVSPEAWWEFQWEIGEDAKKPLMYSPSPPYRVWVRGNQCLVYGVETTS